MVVIIREITTTEIGTETGTVIVNVNVAVIATVTVTTTIVTVTVAATVTTDTEMIDTIHPEVAGMTVTTATPEMTGTVLMIVRGHQKITGIVTDETTVNLNIHHSHLHSHHRLPPLALCLPLYQHQHHALARQLPIHDHLPLQCHCPQWLHHQLLTCGPCIQCLNQC